MVFALQILIKTYIFQRADEALFIVNSKLRALLVSIPTGDIVLKGSEPGFSVQGVNVGCVLEPLNELLYIILDWGVTVIKSSTHNNLNENKHEPAGF